MNLPRETFVSLLVPLEIRLPPNEVLTVDENPLFVILGEYEEHTLGFKIPRGVRMVMSATVVTMDEAETAAKERAMTWVGLMGFAMGVRASLPRVECVLQRLDIEGSYKIRAYSYDAMLTANVPLDVDHLSRITNRVAVLPASARERVGLAIRWYTVGLGQMDDLDRFLSHWVGLEAIGDLLHNRLHEFDRAACQVCDHPPGATRDGPKAGMQHTVAVVSGRADFFGLLDNARNMLFHGLEEIQTHSATIVQHVSTLEIALVRGILEVIRPEGSSETESAGEPLRTVATAPQLRFEGTLIDLTDEEREEILYRSDVQIINAVESGENDDDAGLRVREKYGGKVPESLGSRLVDRRTTRIKMPGVEFNAQ